MRVELSDGEEEPMDPTDTLQAGVNGSLDPTSEGSNAEMDELDDVPSEPHQLS